MNKIKFKTSWIPLKGRFREFISIYLLIIGLSYMVNGMLGTLNILMPSIDEQLQFIGQLIVGLITAVIGAILFLDKNKGGKKK